MPAYRRRGRGRPNADIDADKVAEMALLGLHAETIGHRLGVDADTIIRNFAGLLEQKRAERRELIARAQLKALVGDNITMAIWLGKNELGQTDRTDVTTGGQPLQSTYEVKITPTDKARQAVRGRRRLATVNGNGRVT